MLGLARKWGEALDVVQRWDTLDPLDQDVFDAEWPLTIDYLVRLLRYREQGLFSSDQESRLQEIRQFMQAHAHKIDAVLGPGEARLNPSLQ
ncbi:hypothetical protein BH23CHL1_BH23CHL1_07220 [soil metagenome]